VSRPFGVAVFYAVSPAEVLGLPLAEFILWEREAYRIAEARAQAVGGET
jgi:hypothetical protein